MGSEMCIRDSGHCEQCPAARSVLRLCTHADIQKCFTDVSVFSKVGEIAYTLFPTLLFSFSDMALRTLRVGRFINLIVLDCC